MRLRRTKAILTRYLQYVFNVKRLVRASYLLMDFEGAILAMIDEDQKDAVNAFFEKLTDLYIKLMIR